jgi:hypothetical protein
MQMEKQFSVEGRAYTLAEMLDANSDDSELCEWLTSAQVGESFPAFVSCERVF